MSGNIVEIDVDALMVEEEASPPSPVDKKNVAAHFDLMEVKSGSSQFPFYENDRIQSSDEDLVYTPAGVQSREATGGMYNSSHDREKEAHLSFTNLRYEVDVGTKKEKSVKHILKGLSGEIHPGQVLAIMGASGAGKTTLLNMLAGRLSDSGNGRSSGRILVNGEKRDYTTFRKFSAYVLQHDVFFAELTVRETIALSATLRLHRSIPMEEKMKRVDDVIAELGLKKCQDTIVGNDLLRGISGGEKKRCNIGTELVVDPSLVFLDEPTTGLDAFNAQNVMTTLLSLARAGRTIVCTLHQPRSEIYATLDQLLLLTEGYMAYFGPANAALGYFSSIGFNCPSTYNPSDYFLDVMSYDSRDAGLEKKSRKRIQYLAERYNDFQEKQHASDPSKLMLSTQSKALVQNIDDVSKYAASWVTQFSVIMARSFKILRREKATNIARIMQVVVFSILLGMIWFEEGKNLNGMGVQAVSGAVFFILINQSFSGTFQIIFVFPIERSIVLKERASRTYGAGSYFLAKLLAELPRTFILNTFFVLVVYFMVHLDQSAESFFKFLLAIFTTTLSAESIAYAVSAVARDPQQAGALAPVFIVTSILFGGFFIGSNSIPVWLSWLKYISYLNYGFAASMQSQFSSDLMLNQSGCPPNQVFCPTSGSDVISYYGLDELSYWENIVILCVFTLVVRLLAYMFLRRGSLKYDTSL
eukprot:m.35641 g.35641  ORF g.35641 m.35641 type:complete len:699 (-) comp6617_c0_seq1:341-2437(-)